MKLRLRMSLLALLISTISLAQVPSTINFQGILTDSNDELIEGTTNLTFRIYDEAVAGNLLWEEEQTSVVINKGVFNVLMGSVTPFDLDFDKPYYLSVQRGNENELDPRIDLSSVPYSLTSDKANNVYGETNMVPSTGNVGFGTTDPTQTVDINGTVRVRGGSPGNGKVLTSDASGVGSWQTVNTPSETDPEVSVTTNGIIPKWNGTTLVNGSIIDNGKVGIGTANPLASLHVEESGADDPLRVRVDALSKLIVKNDGKVGVATADPTETFDVNGKIRIRGGSPGSGKVLTSDGNGVASWATAATGGVAGIDSNGGKIGIGTTTQKVTLSVNGKTYIKGDGDQGTGDTFAPTIDLSIDDSDSGLEVPTDGVLTMFTNNIERVRLNSAGQMGVGTTGPNSMFHVDAPSTGDAMRVQIDGGTKFFMSRTGKIAVAGFFEPSYDLDVLGSVAATSFPNTSDRRWKRNIQAFDNGLDKVLALRGVTFDWRLNEFPDKGFEKGGQIGFIAQEVEKVLPDLVTTNNEGYKSVKYANITAVLVEAIKEQQKIIESLQNELDESKEVQAQFSAELTELKSMVLKEIRKQNKKSLTASN